MPRGMPITMVNMLARMTMLTEMGRRWTYSSTTSPPPQEDSPKSSRNELASQVKYWT